jgi:uncharacterized protein (DUF488 family)
MPGKTLFTIGYEKSTPDALVAALDSAGVRTLIDVRAVAASRRAGFSKRALAERLERAGIVYLHLRDLGTPKAGRDAARAGDTPTMRRIFDAHMEKPEAQAALSDAIRIAKESPVCLLCLERAHDDCHRAIVAEMMRQRGGFRVEPLLP